MVSVMSQEVQKLSPKEKLNTVHIFHSKRVPGYFFWTKWLFKFSINKDQARRKNAMAKAVVLVEID